MIEPQLSFLSAILKCIKRTREQRDFEEKLYIKGLEQEQRAIIHKINEMIGSKEFAVKFILQELDVARKGDSFLQYFVKKSGFHLSEYSGALEKFQQEREEIEKIQSFFLDFLNKISDEKIMFQTAIAVLNGVMEHWEIGKYSDESSIHLEEELIEEEVAKEITHEKSAFTLYVQKLKVGFFNKLLYADNKIQEVLDAFSMDKEENTLKEEKKEVIKTPLKIYTGKKVNALMEEYSHVIEEIITGKLTPEHNKEILVFQEQISLATVEGNNLASVFCAFFEAQSRFPTLPLPISQMDNKSKIFFIEILNTFHKKGFSVNLYQYFEENRENVYALATKNDMFMQYIIGFWYVWENEDKDQAMEEQHFWYSQSALNGFEPAIKKIEKSNISEEKSK